MTDMLQKNKNVAKNVANENSQDLTEQWKKGEFIICNAGKCQYYYVQNEEQKEVIKTEYCLFDDNTPNWQILAPVPSYDEWKEKNNALTALLAEYGKLTKELQDEKEKHMTRISLRSPADEMVIEKQVWESTLNRSMLLQAENAQLKELLKECKGIFDECFSPSAKHGELYKEIDEVLK